MKRFLAAAGAIWFCIAAVAQASAAEMADARIKLFQFQPKTLEIAAAISRVLGWN